MRELSSYLCSWGFCYLLTIVSRDFLFDYYLFAIHHKMYFGNIVFVLTVISIDIFILFVL